jgi:hypothetical protein
LEPGCISAGSESHGWGVSCFMPRRNTLLGFVEVQYYDVQLSGRAAALRSGGDAAPRDVGDVQQAVDTAEVDEHAEVGHVLDHAFEYLTFFEVVEDGFALLLEVLLDEDFVRNNYVVESV